MEVTNSSQLFNWKDYGLKLTIPQESLPDNVNSCTITIQVSLSGQYEFPDGTELAGPVFWLRCEPYCNFTSPLSLEIEHCALPEISNHLSMGRAVCTQKDLPYTFKVLHEATFSKQSSCGVIKLNSFSGFAVLLQKAVLSLFRPHCHYWFDVFNMPPGNPGSARHIHFAVTWNDSAHVMVSCTRLVLFQGILHIE